jgi:hypothetical protein
MIFESSFTVATPLGTVTVTSLGTGTIAPLGTVTVTSLGATNTMGFDCLAWWPHHSEPALAWYPH